jgi:hypothetical protein
MARELVRQGLTVDAENPDLCVLTGCTVIGGYGHEMPAGTHVNVRFGANDALLTVPGGETSVIPYRDVTALEVEGQGAVRTGGGFFGGGFGAQGAVEGMLVASVLNSLTTKTKIETIVGLRTNDWQLFLFWDRATPDTLKRHLAPVFARLETAHQTKAQDYSVPTSGVAGELAKLDELHKSGALDAAEFAEAKKRVLESEAY